MRRAIEAGRTLRPRVVRPVSRGVGVVLLAAAALLSASGCRRLFHHGTGDAGAAGKTGTPDASVSVAADAIPMPLPVAAAVNEAHMAAAATLRVGKTTLGPPILTHGDFYVDDGTVTPPRLFVTDVPANLKLRGRTRLIDRSTGKQLASFYADEDFRISERAGFAIVHEGLEGPALLARLGDGSLVTPRLVSADGAPLVEPLYVLHAKSARVWVAAREHGADGADGGAVYWAGSFAGDPKGDVRLAARLEYEPYDGTYDPTNDTVAWELSRAYPIPRGIDATHLLQGETAAGPCTRLRVAASGETTCSGTGRIPLRGSERTDFLSGDLALFYGPSEDVLVHTGAQVARPLHPPIRDYRTRSCRVVATYADPPRALEACQGKVGPADMTLWGPTKSVTWSEPLLGVGDGGVHGYSLDGLEHDPVIHLADTDGRGAERRSKLFIDVERQVVLHTPEVTPLRAVWGSPRPALAFERRGRSLVLERVEVERGEIVPLATYDDCPGVLRESARSGGGPEGGGRVLVSCVVQPNPSLFVFQHVWSEVIDLDRGVRYRMPVRAEVLLDDGTIVASDRTHDGAEAVFSAHTVYLPTLVDPAGEGSDAATSR